MPHVSLDDDLRTLYALSLRMPGASRDELAFAAGGGSASFTDDLRRLAALGLVTENGDEVEAVAPVTGVGGLLREGLSELHRHLAAVEHLVEQLEPLAADHAAGQRANLGPPAVSRVSGIGEAWEVPLRVALANPPVVSLCCQKDPRSFDTSVLPWIDDLLTIAREGMLAMSLLVESAVLDSALATATLHRFAEAGIQIRVHPHLPSGYYVLGEHAALPVRWGDDLAATAYQFHLVHSTVLVAALTSLFEELWRSAVPLRAAGDPYRQVVVLLAHGLTDEAISRRLGVSVRTVRGRLAKVMAELGVRTRFQAGVVAARVGWLN